MVFRILKSFVKATVLLTIGAGIGIWFAPPSVKALMGKNIAVAQEHTKKLNSGANKLWADNLQKKLTSAGKSLDPRQIDQKTVEAWLTSGKNAFATISDDAKKTQDTLSRANRVISSAKKEYLQYGTLFGM